MRNYTYSAAASKAPFVAIRPRKSVVKLTVSFLCPPCIKQIRNYRQPVPGTNQSPGGQVSRVQFAKELGKCKPGLFKPIPDRLMVYSDFFFRNCANLKLSNYLLPSFTTYLFVVVMDLYGRIVPMPQPPRVPAEMTLEERNAKD
jgi:hypothetical protein